LFENQDSLIDHNFLRQNDIFLDIHSFWNVLEVVVC
jgi:hypothetical protein